MRAFIDVRPASLGRGIHRVAEALRRYAPPDVEIVSDPLTADLVLVHCIGWGSLEGWAFRDDQKLAIAQYCYLTTEDPSPARWGEVWKRAALVWSYYDLPFLSGRSDFPFYFSPLGADAEVFQPDPIRRALWAIVTSGYIAETEGVRECAEACARVGSRMFHLGPDLQLGRHVRFGHGITDRQLAEVYSGARFVAGLRRGEGFELPAAEGLLCGARPIMFDAKHYRDWFDGFAEFVPEADAETVTAAIEALLRRPGQAVSALERAQAAERFAWPRIAAGFWERVR
jgi:hypothetical protein